MGTEKNRLVQYPIPKEVNEDVVKIYGHIISDGHMTRAIDNYKIIYCNKQMKLVDGFADCLSRVFNIGG